MKFLIVTVVLFSSMNAVYLQTEITPERNCISKIHLYAETGDKAEDRSSSDFALNFMYSDKSSSCQSLAVRSFPRLYEAVLYDRPGKDRRKAKGDVWTFEGPSDCSTVENIHRQMDTFMIDFAGCDQDDWNVVDAMIYAESVENDSLVLLANKYAIDQPIDKNALFLSLSSVKRDNCEIKDQCITEVYIMAETAGDHKNAGSDKGHSFRLNDKTFKLYDRVGNDMTRNKGDLWTYTASDIGILRSGEEPCFKFGDVTNSGFTTTRTDGWKIKTAIVTVQLESGDYALLAGDVNLNKWLDNDKSYPDRSDVPLTMRNGGNCADTEIMEMEADEM